MSKQLSMSGGNVVDVAIERRMEQAFLDYSMSVIVGRALPDVRDGLKPVQRRILYSMYESNLTPDRPFRKCASTVGEVMKKYHPHGDSSIYDALVRMAQDFSSREVLIDGHGNFGSVDGDPAAAMRYTECRLSPLAIELLTGIDEDTVEFIENYDGYEHEPSVLPSRFPNLLVNGASGIAVGMATNIAPHNLGETVDAALRLLENPDATVDDLLALMPAPDFPTGARIIEGDGLRQAFETGRGAIQMEAVATTEIRTGNLPRIVITEIPFQVNKASLLEKIAELVQKKTFEAIRDLRDESSRDGMRIVIELKRGEDPAVVLERLYRATDLRTNFHANLVALVDDAPQTLSVRECLTHYVAFQREVLTRRTSHRLEKAEARAHILEGLLIALDHLDDVIDLIRGSRSAEEARTGLIERFEMTELQATAVLDMQLRRLAALERAKIEDEYQELQETIERLREILDDPSELDALLAEELRELKRVHATPRRSRIVQQGIAAEDVLAGGSQAGFEAQEVTVLVTRGGYLKPVMRRRTTPKHKHAHDPLAAVVRCTTDDTLLLVDTAGDGYRLDVGDFPVNKPRDRGTHVGQLLGTSPEAPLAGAVPLTGAEGLTVLTVTAAGVVKRTAVEDFESRTRSLQAAGLKGDDEIAAVALVGDGDHIVLAHDHGLVTRFPADEVRSMGRTASGVTGMKVPDGARIVAATVIPAGDDSAGEMLTVGADGSAKRSPLADYSAIGRGGKGVRAGPAALLFCGMAADLHVHADKPFVVRAVDLPEAKRTGKGVPLEEAATGAVVPEAGPLEEA